MYGKIFESMYEGSMVGAGPVVFAVWGYCIAKADEDGTVLLNPSLLAPVIGTDRDNIDGAVDYLTSPDEHSKNPAHEGRRLLHQSGYMYFVVSHEHYRAIKNNADRRKYMRDYMRKKRKSDPVNINKVNGELTKVNPASASASVNDSGGESEGGEKKKQKKPKTKKPERKRNELLDAVAVCDGELSEINQAGWGRAAIALKEIKEVSPDVTPDEIRRRAKNYQTHFDDAIISSTALSKWWAKCKTPKTKPGAPQQKRLVLT